MTQEFNICVKCDTPRQREILRDRLGSKPAITRVVDGEDLHLIVTTNTPKLVNAITSHCGAQVVSGDVAEAPEPTPNPDPIPDPVAELVAAADEVDEEEEVEEEEESEEEEEDEEEEDEDEDEDSAEDD